MERVKVSDFGTSTKLFNMSSPSAAHQHRHHLTTNLGTPAYMAPELVSDGRVVATNGVAATQVDVYSFAILLYTFTTGLKPYADLRTVNMFTMMNAITDNLRPTLPDDYPAALGSILQKAWVGDPLLRPTCQELIPMLESAEVLEALGQLDLPKSKMVKEKKAAMNPTLGVRNGEFDDGQYVSSITSSNTDSDTPSTIQESPGNFALGQSSTDELELSLGSGHDENGMESFGSRGDARASSRFSVEDFGSRKSRSSRSSRSESIPRLTHSSKSI
jgi:serine/threonine protein kinase